MLETRMMILGGSQLLSQGVTPETNKVARTMSSLTIHSSESSLIHSVECIVTGERALCVASRNAVTCCYAKAPSCIMRKEAIVVKSVRISCLSLALVFHLRAPSSLLEDAAQPKLTHQRSSNVHLNPEANFSIEKRGVEHQCNLQITLKLLISESH